MEASGCPSRRRRIHEDGLGNDASYRNKCGDKRQTEMSRPRNNKRSERATGSVVGADEPGEKQRRRNDRDESLEYRCPGTMDVLSGRMVPCSEAPTLREIALGRRMRRTVVDDPECQTLVQDTRLSRPTKIHDVEVEDEKKGKCRCKWNNDKSDYRSDRVDEIEISMYRQRPEACCSRKTKIAKQKGRCVSFDR